VFLVSSERYGLYCYLKSQSDSCSLLSPVINGIERYDTIEILGSFGSDTAVFFSASSSAGGQVMSIKNMFFNQEQTKLISLNISTAVPGNVSLQITAYAFGSNKRVLIEYILLTKRDSSGQNALEGFLLFSLTTQSCL
jgi:hypothetical protein